MMSNIGFISHLTASVAFCILLFILIRSPDSGQQKSGLIVASIGSAIWAGVISIGNTLAYPPVTLYVFSELLRDAGLIFLLLQLNSLRSDGTPATIRGKRWPALFIVGVLFALALLISPEFLVLNDGVAKNIGPLIWLAQSILGLLLLEQLFRNSSESERWSVKFLCFGLGGIFAYDLYMYSEALLFRQLDAQLWQARGFVNALAAPLVAIFIGRYAEWRVSLQPSRQMVFHTVTLMGTGFYLVAMSLAGYYVKFIGGNWGGVLQIAFLVAAGGVLLALLFSGKIRATVRVWLSKHFFSYKYDYRTEWLNFTHALAEADDNVPEGILQAMAGLVSSPAGLLWSVGQDGQLQLLSHWKMPIPEGNLHGKALSEWLLDTGWVIDVNELRREPDLYSGLQSPSWLTAIPNAWLLIPLIFRNRLQGIALLKRSELQQSINWEDRDLLKTAGRQAASHLAQHQANYELVMARQFEAFNRLSAYVVHDLKNILAQQSLMIVNAEKHKDNPAFIDDMIGTVRNSVNRMTGLMEQMRSGVRGGDEQQINLSSMLENIVSNRSQQSPTPTLELSEQDLRVQSDIEQLATVFDHLIQNAQEATHKTGWVKVRLFEQEGYAVTEIADSGVGMDNDFVMQRLFRPFDSTKGLTGMGIGAFESREFIRSLGGDISVVSSPGEGSLFRVTVPCAKHAGAV